jgi:dTMP kinase
MTSKYTMIKNSYPGKFIVFEGLDGSGQSTQVKLLGDFLKKRGYQVILTKEPTQKSLAGQKIKEDLDKKTKIDPAQLQRLFAQDRKEHLEKITIPNLKEGRIVISDRYFFSSLAYGSIDLSLDWLIDLNKDFLYPDMTFILKVRPEICLERIRKRDNNFKLFEQQEKLTKAWRGYELLSQRFENIYMIDGEPPKEVVFTEIKELVIAKLNL